MKEKLTLSIEKETKERAKRHAKALGRSVSQMVEDFLNEATVNGDDVFTPEPGSVTESLMGSLELPKKYKGKDYKEIKQEMLAEKYAN